VRRERQESASLGTLDPRFRPYAERFILMLGYNGFHTQLTSTRRSKKFQRYLYREYVAGRRTLPAAPPGHSMHELGLAFDLIVTPEAGQPLAGQAWERLGGRWGGSRDPVHFEARVR